MTVHDAAVVDTSIIAALKLYDPAELPAELPIACAALLAIAAQASAGEAIPVRHGKYAEPSTFAASAPDQLFPRAVACCA